MNLQIGKLLVVLGALLVVAGAVIWLTGDKLQWLGRLPGDFRIECERLKIYFPLTTMLIISVIITLLINILRRIF